MAETFEDHLANGEAVTAAVGTLASSFADRQADVDAALASVDADIDRLGELRADLEDVTDATAAVLAEESGNTTQQIEELVTHIDGLREAASTRFADLVARFDALRENVESAKETLSGKYQEALEAQAQLVESLHNTKGTVSSRVGALADALTEQAAPAIQRVEEEMGATHQTVLTDWQTARSQSVEQGARTLSTAVDAVRANASRLLEEQRAHVGEASRAALGSLQNSMQNSVDQVKRRATEIERTIDRVKNLATTTAKTTSTSIDLLDDSSKSVGIGLQAALGCLLEMKKMLERGRN